MQIFSVLLPILCIAAPMFIGIWVITRSKNISKNNEKIVGIAETQDEAEAKMRKLIRRSGETVLRKRSIPESSTTFITETEDSDELGSLTARKWKDYEKK